MKKHYKPTYGFTLFLSFFYLYCLVAVACIPMLIIHGSTNGTSGIEIVAVLIFFDVFLVVIIKSVKGIMKMFNLGTVKMYNLGIFFFVI